MQAVDNKHSSVLYLAIGLAQHGSTRSNCADGFQAKVLLRRMGYRSLEPHRGPHSLALMTAAACMIPRANHCRCSHL
jgi:hypothetical protein